MKLSLWIISTVLLLETLVLGFLVKYIPLEIALQSIKIHQYTETYRCNEFSQDLVDKLGSFGIQASRIGGDSPETLDKDYGHTWVGIWIEPQTGKFTHNYITN